ncbi:MAG: penicillin-binding protein 1C [Xanthomonadales bacterium]|nr:penicillin-binding protein 1C [Xanthomonadales bacterium]
MKGTHGASKLRRWWRRLGAALALLVLVLALDRLFPPPLEAFARQRAAQVVVDGQGRTLRAFADQRGVWRTPVAVEEVSPYYLQALLNYEDRRFYLHPGVDPLALIRALGQAVIQGEIVSGGSTLTMQVARLVEDLPHSYAGKLLQMVRALQIEARLSKREILELYLAHAPFGGPIEGVEAAARSYLGKSAADLSRAEAALLVVLPQAPSRLRPDRHPQRAQAARDKVLARMASLAVWSAAEVEQAQIEQVVAQRLTSPQFAPLLARRLAGQSDRQRVVSSIELEWQRTVEERVAAYMDRLPLRSSAAVLVLEAESALTRVYVGSARFADPQRLGHVDMVIAPRSPGSTLKPFLYGLALERGLIHSESLLVDAPRSLRGYRPSNFGGSFQGPVGAADALRLSLNVPAVDLLERVGPAAFAAKLAHAGLTLRLPPGAEPNLSIILGGAATNLEELVGAYRALAANGLSARPRLGPDQPLQERRLLYPGSAWIIRQILERDPFSAGSGALFLPGRSTRLAWKTGTSFGYRDTWAIGISGGLVIGVWIGRPDGTPMPGEYGAVTALPLLAQVLQSLPPVAQSVTQPDSVSEAEVCWPLGLAPDPEQPQLCQQRHQAWLLDQQLPPTLPDLDVDRWQAARVEYWFDPERQRRLNQSCMNPRAERRVLARWPLRAEPWLSAAQRRASTLPALADGCEPDQLAPAQLLIRGLNDGSVLRAASGPGQPISLELSALGSDGPIYWLLDNKVIGETRGSASLALRLQGVARHRLLAIADDGRSRRLDFSVR